MSHITNPRITMRAAMTARITRSLNVIVRPEPLAGGEGRSTRHRSVGGSGSRPLLTRRTGGTAQHASALRVVCVVLAGTPRPAARWGLAVASRSRGPCPGEAPERGSGDGGQDVHQPGSRRRSRRSRRSCRCAGRRRSAGRDRTLRVVGVLGRPGHRCAGPRTTASTATRGRPGDGQPRIGGHSVARPGRGRHRGQRPGRTGLRGGAGTVSMWWHGLDRGRWSRRGTVGSAGMGRKRLPRRFTNFLQRFTDFLPSAAAAEHPGARSSVADPRGGRRGRGDSAA
jgi:hypothetical protein